MKKLQKLAGVLLALVMVMGLSVTAFATGEYTLTINDTEEGHTYEAYQIFSGTLSGSGTAAEPYVLADIEWGSGVDADAVATDAFKTALQGVSATVDGTTVYPFASCATAQNVADVLGNYTDTDSAVAVAFADFIGQYLSTTTSGTFTGSGTTYTISELDAGYYLVKDEDDSIDGNDAYTRYMLQIAGNTSVNRKAATPTVEKKVLEEDYTEADTSSAYYGTGYNDVADYDIGDNVPFMLTGTMPSNISYYDTYTYIFHDTLSTGLTFNENSVTVKVDDTVIPATYDDKTNYEVIYDSTTAQSDGCTFEVEFEDVKSLVGSDGNAITVAATSKIVVTYTAKLNSSAEIGLNGNPNTVCLEYSNNPNTGGEGDTGETPEDKVIVFTYELDVTKADDTDLSTADLLKDAQFVLYKGSASSPSYAIVDTDTGKITGWTSDEDQATRLTSDDDGFFKVVGLDDGTYYLREKVAPTGYNLLTDDVEIVIAATTDNGQDWDMDPETALTALTISVDGKTAANGVISTGVVSATIVNQAGASLPTTGGIGTTIFYIVGSVLLLSAVVLLITRRRMRRA